MAASVLAYIPAEAAPIAAIVFVVAIVIRYAVVPFWTRLDRTRHERHVRRVVMRELRDSRWRERKLSTLRRKTFYPPKAMLSAVLLAADVEQRTRRDGEVMVRLHSR